MTTHAQGPHEQAKKKMKKHTKAIKTLFEVVLLTAVPTMALLGSHAIPYLRGPAPGNHSI